MSEQSKIRLAIGLPSYGGKVATEHCRMFLELGHTLACSEQRFLFKHLEYIDVCGVERARNALIAKAMIADANWLLMLDSDTWVEGDADGAGYVLLRMISEAQKLGATLVGAPVVRRHLPGQQPELNIYDIEEIHETSMKLRIAHNQPKLFGVGAIGAACIAMDLQKIGDSVFRFTDTLSEDLSFCHQIQKLGGSIYADGRVRTAHMGRAFPLYSAEK